MKVTVVKKSDNKINSLVYSIVMLVLGIILVFNSNGLMTILFDILGCLVIIYGIYSFNTYYKIKKEFKTDDAMMLVSALSSIVVGLLIIILSSILTNAIQIVTGIWLFFIGLSKLNTSICFKDVDKQLFSVNLIGAILFFLLGLYTIIAKNVVFIIIGIILIVVSVYDIFNYLKK